MHNGNYDFEFRVRTPSGRVYAQYLTVSDLLRNEDYMHEIGLQIGMTVKELMQRMYSEEPYLGEVGQMHSVRYYEPNLTPTSWNDIINF